MRIYLLLISLFASSANAFTLQFSSADFSVTPQFSSVDTFQFTIDVQGGLQAGVYSNPALVNVIYSVSGSLVAGTPSGFPAFDLQRTISGDDFYDQGSSLVFEIAATADLSDGLQADELVGGNNVFVFNGREIDNGRFHPALLELNSDGTGQMQNSNNVPSTMPLNEVSFGAEYITDLVFDPGNLTLVSIVTTPVNPVVSSSSGGGGTISIVSLILLVLFSIIVICRFVRYPKK